MLVCFVFIVYFVKRVVDNWFNGSWLFILLILGLMIIWNIKVDIYVYLSVMFGLLMFFFLFGISGKNFIIYCKKKEEENV